ncbi:thiol-disulfide oxidoreductase DCC family protein [Thermogymnomonas acidicola]|nr:hypothetical protein [Thermogymnomonas acidicola]
MYDDTCRLCSVSAGALDPSELVRASEVGDPSGLEGVILITESGKYVGFDAVLEIAKRKENLFPLLPALLFLQVTGLGNLLYRAVAERRHSRAADFLASLIGVFTRTSRSRTGLS